MTPTLRPGDRLLVDYRRTPVAGDLVLARFPDGALVVKRAVRAQPTASGRSGWYLLSDNPDEGVDSRHRGPLPADTVLAVVRRRVWPWRKRSV
ncbi:MAG: S24/S26 family peptidase [Nocardioidaceae bacterium]|nr:S24/S26 family peptidase [Nocardioidaceae bacterium]